MTFTIVARDSMSGEMGVATTTCLVGVGDVVPAAKAGVGVVACQAYIRPSSREALFTHLDAGTPLKTAVSLVLSGDENASQRQILGMDLHGAPFVYTGCGVDHIHGGIVGEHHAVAGNLLAHESVLHAMDMSFRSTSDLSLAQRLVKALTLGEQAGGDKRGRMSAALLVVAPTRRSLSLRIDYSQDPLNDLHMALEHRISPELDEAFNR